MTEVYNLAEKIYNDAVLLKGQKSTSLTWKYNREKWLAAIAEMRESVVRMGEILDYSYSDEHFELIEEMKDILCACEKGLREKTYRYKAQSTNYMQAFHNLPRAFFALEDNMRISVYEARKYASFWLDHGRR
jgi:hypothetical protein